MPGASEMFELGMSIAQPSWLMFDLTILGIIVAVVVFGGIYLFGRGKQ